MARAISKILFILGPYNFLEYLECVRSYAWSKGHSDPDLSSVSLEQVEFIQNWQCFASKHKTNDELRKFWVATFDPHLSLPIIVS